MRLVDPCARSDPAGSGNGSKQTASRLRGSEALKLHMTLAGGVTLCIVAFLIEVKRALDGNELSWAYVFEWPLFAVFAVYMWWTNLHQSRHGLRSTTRPKTVAPEHADMLRKWQDHQRSLAATESDPVRPTGTDADRS